MPVNWRPSTGGWKKKRRSDVLFGDAHIDTTGHLTNATRRQEDDDLLTGGFVS
jgi:hypothetical protein